MDRSTKRWISAAGRAPSVRPRSVPPLKTNRLGSAWILKRWASNGKPSVFIFATTNLPPLREATRETSGAIILHGPHQSAQKSTSTGNGELSNSDSNAASSSMSIGESNPGNSVLQRPQRVALPKCPKETRFICPHVGQVLITPWPSSRVAFMPFNIKPARPIGKWPVFFIRCPTLKNSLSNVLLSFSALFALLRG